MSSALKHRKQDHLDICLHEAIETSSTGFSAYTFVHNALPEIDFADIDTSIQFLGKKLSAPVIISSMTGGVKQGTVVNQHLAGIAEELQIGMGVGSQRIALVEPQAKRAFSLRKIIPTSLLLANLGAVELNYGYTAAEYQRVVDMIAADGLYIHLNPLQEALQPEGQTNFSGLLNKLIKVRKTVTVPIIIKEVGSGISLSVAKKLKKAGFLLIEATGKGGTSWPLIESYRSGSSSGVAFADWGLTTAESIQTCVQVPELTVIAGGGIRTGVDVAKALCLGAEMVSIGLPVLKAAEQSYKHAKAYLQNVIRELKVVLFCLGIKNIAELKRHAKKVLRKKEHTTVE